METASQDDFNKLYFTEILPSEGGYSPHDPNTGDPETLFGVTIKEWQRGLQRVSAEQLDYLPGDLRDRIHAVQNAGNGKQLAAATQDFMQYVGRLLPCKGEQPAVGTPKTSRGCDPSPDAPDWQKAQVRDVQNIAFQIFYRDFVQEPGFDKRPAFIAPYLCDFGMNAGTGAAVSVLRSSMREIGVDHLDNLVPTQKAELIDRFNSNARAYYQQIAERNPAKATYLKGWNNRVTEFHKFVRANWDNTLPAIIEDSAPPALQKQEYVAVQFAPLTSVTNGVVQPHIAMEIPGHGVAIYEIDVHDRYVKAKSLPKGVDIDLPNADTDRKAFSNEDLPVISWLNKDGERRYVTLGPEMNKRIRLDTTDVRKVSNWGRALNAASHAVFGVSRKHLDQSLSDLTPSYGTDEAATPMEQRPLPGETPWPQNGSLTFPGARPEENAREVTHALSKYVGNVSEQQIQNYMSNAKAPLPVAYGIDTEAMTNVQYVTASLRPGLKPIIDPERIAVEIPNRGVATFSIDKNGGFGNILHLPEGVTLESPAVADRNPYYATDKQHPGANTLSWMDDNGKRQYIPLNATLLARIKEAGSTPMWNALLETFMKPDNRYVAERSRIFPQFAPDEFQTKGEEKLDPAASNKLIYDTPNVFAAEKYYVVNPRNGDVPDAPPATPIYRGAPDKPGPAR